MPKSLDHLKHRKSQFHIVIAASGECVSFKCLYCLKILHLQTMSPAIKMAETEEKWEKALSARVAEEEPK